MTLHRLCTLFYLLPVTEHIQLTQQTFLCLNYKTLLNLLNHHLPLTPTNIHPLHPLQNLHHMLCTVPQMKLVLLNQQNHLSTLTHYYPHLRNNHTHLIFQNQNRISSLLLYYQMIYCVSALYLPALLLIQNYMTTHLHLPTPRNSSVTHIRSLMTLFHLLLYLNRTYQNHHPIFHYLLLYYHYYYLHLHLQLKKSSHLTKTYN